MRYICKAKCMFRGDICKPGAVLDIDPAGVPAADAAVFRSSFEKEAAEAPAEGKPGKGGKPKKLGNGLTREQAVEKLEKGGFPVPEGLTDAELEGFYAKAFAATSGAAQAQRPPEAAAEPPSVLDGAAAEGSAEAAEAPAEGKPGKGGKKKGE